MLVGNPIIAEGLKQRKIFRFDATVQVVADGRVTHVEFAADANLSSDMAAAIGDAFEKAAVFVPAVDNGKFVDGVYAYHFEIAH